MKTLSLKLFYNFTSAFKVRANNCVGEHFKRDF